MRARRHARQGTSNLRREAAGVPLIGGIVIAAGASRRMGTPKQLLDLGGRPLLRWSIDALQAVKPRQLLLVVGHEASRIAGALRLDGVQVVVNERYAEGQSTSLRAGLAALEQDIEAALVLAGDQPLVTADHLIQLVRAYRGDATGIIATQYEDHRGVPMLLARAIWPLAAGIAGDQGARALLRAVPERVASVEAPDRAMAMDVDTPEQYAAVRALVAERGA